MKKLTIVFLVITTIILTLSSCKTHQTCPAYSKINPQIENTTHS